MTRPPIPTDRQVVFWGAVLCLAGVVHVAILATLGAS